MMYEPSIRGKEKLSHGAQSLGKAVQKLWIVDQVYMQTEGAELVNKVAVYLKVLIKLSVLY